MYSPPWSLNCIQRIEQEREKAERKDEREESLLLLKNGRDGRLLELSASVANKPSRLVQLVSSRRLAAFSNEIDRDCKPKQ